MSFQSYPGPCYSPPQTPPRDDYMPPPASPLRQMVFSLREHESYMTSAAYAGNPCPTSVNGFQDGYANKAHISPSQTQSDSAHRLDRGSTGLDEEEIDVYALIDDFFASNARQIGPSLWTCMKCSKNYSRDYDLKRHISTSHVEKGNFKCSVATCGRLFKRKDCLYRHMMKIHNIKHR